MQEEGLKRAKLDYELINYCEHFFKKNQYYIQPNSTILTIWKN